MEHNLEELVTSTKKKVGYFLSNSSLDNHVLYIRKYWYFIFYFLFLTYAGLGTIFGTLFLITVSLVLFNVIKKRSEIKLKKKFFKKNGGLLLQQQLSSNENNVQNITLFNSRSWKRQQTILAKTE